MKVLKWLFVALVMGLCIWLTLGWFYGMAVDVTYSLRGLPLSEGVTSFIVNTGFVSIYVLLFWFLAGALDLLPTIREFIADHSVWLFLLIWFGGSALAIVAIFLAVLAFAVYLFFGVAKEEASSGWNFGGGGSGYGGSAGSDDYIKKQRDAYERQEEIRRANRGLIRDQDAAARGGNGAEVSRIQGQLDYNKSQL